jgi:replicative DNA helicase
MLVGFPETGKTSFLLNFCYNLITNPNNLVIMYSLDDGAKRAILPRLLSIITDLTPKEIKQPDVKNKVLWDKGINTLFSLKDNFILKDGADIRTVWDLDNLINIHYSIAQEKNKKLILLIDNLHALVSSSKVESTENTQRIAAYLKRLPQKLGCPIIATAEVPKSAGTKPTGKDIKESIDLWYAARFVGGLNSDAAQKGDSNLLWQCDSKMMPIIELYISKNQTGESWHGSLFYKFDSNNHRLIECSLDETKLLRENKFLY